MPKQKTHKGLKNRVRVTRNGKVMRMRPGRRHLLSSKTGNRKRKLRKNAQVARMFTDMVQRLLRPIY